MISFTHLVVFAQAQGQGLLGTLPLIAVLFAVMYFVMIRPAQKQAKDQATLLSSLKKGDDVITLGGILGKIHAVADKVVTVEVANGVKLRVLKSAIQGKVSISDEPARVAADEEIKKEGK